MHRSLRIITLALLIPQSGFAQSDTQQSDHCSDWAFLGRLTMKLRQDGIPIKLAFDAANVAMSDMESPDSLRDPVWDMIRHAYRHPLETTDRLAEVAAIRFSERLFNGCMAHLVDQ